MDRRINPFNELYLTETISSSQFVKIFSPVVLRNAEALFLPGNVVLTGVQGSGKSMLLNLLKPDIRIAYAQLQEEFPLKRQLSQFVGAGINLTRSRAIDFGQRPISSGATDPPELLAFFFGDFFNYWIVSDLLHTIQMYKDQCDGIVAKHLGLDVKAECLDRCAKLVGRLNSWFGFLDGVSTFADLQERISSRIQIYRKFFQFNVVLPPDFLNSKTLVGEPLSETVETLKASGVVPDEVHILVRIDQYEELSKVEAKYGSGPLYTSVINKALSLRNPQVSYRVGARTYAFREDRLNIFGSTARLERDRNYKLIDLDQVLRRKERGTWLFPRFAEDVFERRMRFAGYDTPGDSSMIRVFQKGLSPEDRAKRYCGKTPEKAIRVEPDWPEEWQSFLLKLAAINPLSARLGEAWAKQKRRRDVIHTIPTPPYPWETKATAYWRKERVQAALMQIAGRCRQRMIWSGKSDILELSGGNILVFVGICQHVFAAWLRTAHDDEPTDNSLPTIDELTQAVGIHEASAQWYEKLTEEPEGNKRQRFVTYVFSLLERNLFRDAALSYPGGNGFSISLEDVNSDSKVKEFLNDAVDYGALFDSPHTTKLQDRKPRWKWYLNPILTPHFRLPHIRTKEPVYVTLPEVKSWIEESVSRGNMVPSNEDEQQPGGAKQEELLFARNDTA